MTDTKTTPDLQMETPSSTLSDGGESSYWFVELRDAVGAWSRHNFGEQGAYRPMIGMVEELTEFIEAHDLGDRVKEKDAIGDIVIYMADYFYRRQWDIAWVWENRYLLEKEPSIWALHLIGKLSHSHLKSEQGIRGGAEKHDMEMRKACAGVLGFLDEMSSLNGDDVIATIQDVWDEVKKRDWKKNPDNAHEVAAVSVFDNPQAAAAAREIIAEIADGKL